MTFGQAVQIGNQVQAWVLNNSMVNCHQGVQIPGTHNSGECPPNADTNGGDIGITRNTRVAIMNNVFLDTPSAGGTHVRVSTGPYDDEPDWPFTLTSGRFGHNLHFGTYRLFKLPHGDHISVQQLREAPFNCNYGLNSRGDLPEDNPNLDDPARLSFYLRTTPPVSPPFMFTGGVKDEAYDAFLAAFPGFPHIYRDHAGIAYSGQTCAIGAFGTVAP